MEKGDGLKQKRPVLTDFGRAVLLEDNSLTEPLTQWIAHLHLCRSDGGAEIWHNTFGSGRNILGSEFSEEELNEFLNGIFGKKKKSHIGPMLRTYEEQAGLKNARVFETNYNVLEWNDRFNRYEIIGDAVSRSAFTSFLRSHVSKVTAEQVEEIFTLNIKNWGNISNETPDFATNNNKAFMYLLKKLVKCLRKCASL
ncbi:hypothetical protein QUF76_09305 [Desulfobacterales bacterium HSG16]|nr:hypothetical protein [Desulfobacterales bacterium HSG16]